MRVFDVSGEEFERLTNFWLWIYVVKDGVSRWQKMQNPKTLCATAAHSSVRTKTEYKQVESSCYPIQTFAPFKLPGHHENNDLLITMQKIYQN